MAEQVQISTKHVITLTFEKGKAEYGIEKVENLLNGAGVTIIPRAWGKTLANYEDSTGPTLLWVSWISDTWPDSALFKELMDEKEGTLRSYRVIEL
jgi:hypothetical protein